MSTLRRSLVVTHNKTNSNQSFQVTGTGMFSEAQVPRQPSVVKSTSKYSVTSKYTPGFTMRSGKTTNAKSVRLSDMMAAMYPGLKVGHKKCVEKMELVPKTMGWLWNTEDTATGEPFPHGWRPGAIALGVRKRSLRSRLLSEPLSQTPTGLKKKKIIKKPGKLDALNTFQKCKSCTSSLEIDVPPTLFVHKEHGVYHVKMRPIKNKGGNENLEEQTPVQFQIADSLNSSSQQSQSSSSSLKIEYLCTGALRKPTVKPELAEMGTQWDTSDFEKKEIVVEKKLSEEEKPQKKGKKKQKAPINEETKKISNS